MYIYRDSKKAPQRSYIMTFDELFSNTFSALSKNIDHAAIREQVSFMLPSMPMVHACRADDLDFFQPLMDAGDLTVAQMHHAAQSYYLGKSRSGLPIFWMIDELGFVLDGHIDTDIWISSLLKKREPLLQYWQVSHCLFGLHLLTDMPVSIVESEVSAVILSELCPESVWMAYVSPENITIDLMDPLQDHTVTIYPRTDPTMSNNLFFLDFASQVRQVYPSIHLTIDDTLEDEASESQKSRCIDLLDFILE